MSNGASVVQGPGLRRASQGVVAADAYSNVFEHLDDLLLLLELQIRLEFARRPTKQAPDFLSFAAITDDEMDGLLRRGHDDGAAMPTPDPGGIGKALAELDRHIGVRVAETQSAGRRLPLIELVRDYHLSDLEVHILVACLAVELDRKYERIFGYLQDDMGRRRPTIGLLLYLFRSSAVERMKARSLLLPDAPLLGHRLLIVADEDPVHQPFPARSLRVDDRIVAFVTESSWGDPHLDDLISWKPPDEDSVFGSAESELHDRLFAWLCKQVAVRSAEQVPVLHLYGRTCAEKVHVVQSLCGRLQLGLLHVDAELLAASTIGWKCGLSIVLRESTLRQGALCIEHLDRVLDQDSTGLRLRTLVNCLRAGSDRPIFLLGEQPWRWEVLPSTGPWLSVELPGPGFPEQVAIWRRALHGFDLPDPAISQLASLHPLSMARATAAVKSSRAIAALCGHETATLSHVARSCREQVQPSLGQLATKVELAFSWDDLVLPERVTQQLHDICVQAKHRCHVYGTWGFGKKLSLGKGLSVLFAGPSGTGKTMSAQVIAAALGLNLYKIDLSQVVSKYIGETEKSLHRIFAVAQAANVVLFFDEADALLGKRSEVRDAHDRYANIEVAYLLQKMEEYEGVTVLATNLRQNIDEAFTRRIRFIVDFPFPDAEDRLRIWRGIWPQETPLDEKVDLTWFANQFRLNGGNIRNIALAAAFLASEQERSISMHDLTTATKRELEKMGRLVDDGCKNNG